MKRCMSKDSILVSHYPPLTSLACMFLGLGNASHLLVVICHGDGD